MKHILKRIIADFHQQPYPKLIPRQKVIPSSLEKIITVIGPRRAGKTCALFQIMKELEQSGVPRQQILYMNFEDERLDIGGDYDQIVEAWQELYPDADLSRCYFFFDEIQVLKNWETFVRRMHDTKTRHIFLTGSNSRLLSKEIASSLRGGTQRAGSREKTGSRSRLHDSGGTDFGGNSGTGTGSDKRSQRLAA